MRRVTAPVALSTLFANNSATNTAAKTLTDGELLLVPVTTTDGSGIYEQMGVSSDGHTVSWKLRGISKDSAAGLYSTPEVWETGNTVPTGDVYPKRIQIYVL
jgi:hypothetical protein